jgi:hypothetical protein
MIQKYKMQRLPEDAETIEAVVVSWATWQEVCDLLDGAIINEKNPARKVKTFASKCGEKGPEYIEFTIPKSGEFEEVIVQHGDILAKGPFKPFGFMGFKAEVFHELYEKVR